MGMGEWGHSGGRVRPKPIRQECPRICPIPQTLRPRTQRVSIAPLWTKPVQILPGRVLTKHIVIYRIYAFHGYTGWSDRINPVM